MISEDWKLDWLRPTSVMTFGTKKGIKAHSHSVDTELQERLLAQRLKVQKHLTQVMDSKKLFSK